AAFDAPLHQEGGAWRLPVDHLPSALRERAAGIGIDRPVRLVFNQVGPPGTLHATRTHPLVRLFAEYLAERALADEGDVAARCGALFAEGVSIRAVLAILRLRAQIEVQNTGDGALQHLLAEECVVARIVRDGPIALLDDVDSRRLLATSPPRDMQPE